MDDETLLKILSQFFVDVTADNPDEFERLSNAEDVHSAAVAIVQKES